MAITRTKLLALAAAGLLGALVLLDHATREPPSPLVVDHARSHQRVPGNPALPGDTMAGIEPPPGRMSNGTPPGLPPSVSITVPTGPPTAPARKPAAGLVEPR